MKAGAGREAVKLEATGRRLVEGKDESSALDSGKRVGVMVVNSTF